jgi:hypothetical protein
VDDKHPCPVPILIVWHRRDIDRHVPRNEKGAEGVADGSGGGNIGDRGFRPKSDEL